MKTWKIIRIYDNYHIATVTAKTERGAKAQITKKYNYSSKDLVAIPQDRKSTNPSKSLPKNKWVKVDAVRMVNGAIQIRKIGSKKK